MTTTTILKSRAQFTTMYRLNLYMPIGMKISLLFLISIKSRKLFSLWSIYCKKSLFWHQLETIIFTNTKVWRILLWIKHDNLLSGESLENTVAGRIFLDLHENLNVKKTTLFYIFFLLSDIFYHKGQTGTVILILKIISNFWFFNYYYFSSKHFR